MRRDTFLTLGHWEVVLFYALVPVAMGVFAFGLFSLVRKYRQGHGETRLDGLTSHLLPALGNLVTHRGIGRDDRAVGFGHLTAFYGFLALVVATAILFANDDILRPLTGVDLWRDTFYLVYSLLADLFGVALIAGVIVLSIRRLRRPARLDYTRPVGLPATFERRRYELGDWALLGSLLFLGVTGFVIEAYRIAVDGPAYEIWSIAGWSIAQGLRAIGITAPDPATDAFRHSLWWVHAAVALVAVAVIPYTKAVHMLVSPVTLVAHDPGAGRKFSPVSADAAADEVGYGRLRDFSPLHLAQLDACTKCGRCHVACPAFAAGSPLSPRDLVLDLRESAEGSMGVRARIGIPPLRDAARSLIDDPIKAGTLWSCTTCLACVEACPVGVEHVPIINQLRRRLVEMGELDDALQGTLEAIASTGNSFGEPRRRRARWVSDLSKPIKDARREASELLWYAGDHASFDTRAREATAALARVFEIADVDVGLLYEAERTAGCDVRRVGEEGLWRTVAEANVTAIAGCQFERILTSDPHTFHTLRNEYPEVGGNWPVVHHSELLAELVRDGRIVFGHSLEQTVTYHDPCYLGRYNGVYDPPRDVLRALGVRLIEMPRNRSNSFCCGAGGGVIWMKEAARPAGRRRPAELRIEEALALDGVSVFVVACPKDASMFSSAVTSLGCGDRIVVRELAELVLEGLRVGGPVVTAPGPVFGTGSEAADAAVVGA